MNQKELRQHFNSFAKKIYCFEFFNALLFLYPVYAILFRLNGISDTQISVLFIFWSLSVVLANFLYTYLSCYFQNKTLSIIGQLSKILCFVVWMIFPTFLGYSFGFLLWGIQWAFNTRALENLVYNELLVAPHYEQLYTKICSRKKSWSYAGYLISCAGSFLIEYSFNILYISSILSTLVSLFAVMSLNIKYYTKNTRTPIKENITQSLKAIKMYPLVFVFVMLQTIMMGLSYIDEYFGLIGMDIGIPEKYVGFIYVGALLNLIVFSSIAYKFEHIKNTTLFSLVALTGFLFSLICAQYNYYGLIILFVFYALHGILDVLLFSKIQSSVKNQYERSVFLGVFSFFEQFTSIISYGFMAIAGSLGSFRFGFLFLGLIVFMTGILTLLIYKMKTKN